MNTDDASAPPDSENPVPMTGQRRARIAELVNQRGSARVGDLAREFDTSAVTIRSDLAFLEREGRLVRDRGGATAAHRTITSLLAVEERAHLRIREKRRIAHAAAEYVKPGDTILMDAGTTVVHMASDLAKIDELTVITYALNVALQIASLTTAKVMLLGGTYNRRSSSVLGPIAEGQLAELKVPKLFLGAQAFDLEQGLTDTTIEIAQIKRRMIQSAGKVFLLADSSKWDSTGLHKVAPLDCIHTLVTDDGFPKETRAAIEQAGVELVVA